MFGRNIGRKIQDKFKNVWIRFVGGEAFANSPIGSPVNENDKIRQNLNFQIFKNPKRNFVRTIEKKIHEKFENVCLQFVGVAF